MKNLLIIALLCLSMPIFAQNSPQGLIDKFFNTYESDPGAAISQLYHSNPWSDRMEEDIVKVVETISSFTTDFIGEMHGKELLDIQKVTDHYVQYSYLILYDRQPVRFVFKFYKPDNMWFLSAFAVDNTLGQEMEEASKVMYLGE